MNCHRKSILPTSPQQLASKVVDPTIVTTKLEQNQDIRKQHYDRGTKQQAALQPKESVRVQVHNCWIPAKGNTTSRHAQLLHCQMWLWLSTLSK